MSAGHCIISQLSLVRLGAYDLTLPADNVNVIDSSIIAHYVHEQYNAQSISFDISILKLEKTLALTNFVRPACIPYLEPLKSKDYTGRNKIITWECN